MGVLYDLSRRFTCDPKNTKWTLFKDEEHQFKSGYRGYALTLAYHLAGKDENKMWLMIESGEIKLHEADDGNVVVEVNDQYADSVLPYWRESMIHRYHYTYKLSDIVDVKPTKESKTSSFKLAPKKKKWFFGLF